MYIIYTNRSLEAVVRNQYKLGNNFKKYIYNRRRTSIFFIYSRIHGVKPFYPFFSDEEALKFIFNADYVTRIEFHIYTYILLT